MCIRDRATVKVGNGKEIVLHEETNYPFEEGIKFTVSTDEKVDFPFYLRIPSWTEGAEVRVNGKKISVKPVSGNYPVSYTHLDVYKRQKQPKYLIR